jgi:hypothetical protein
MSKNTRAKENHGGKRTARIVNGNEKESER